jgi:hypothetical protein
VQTPVGARCRSCAGLRRLPTFEVSKAVLARAFLAAAATAVVGSIVIDMVRGFGFILTIVLGLLVAETVGWASNRRRGPYLASTAAAGAVVGMVVGRGVPVLVGLGLVNPGAAVPRALAAMASINILGWILILVVAGIAYYRLRQ